MNDRQRIEASIIPALIYGVVKNQGQYQETEEEIADYTLVVKASRDALLEPINDMDARRAGQIQRRLDRLYQEIIPNFEGQSNAKCMMVIYYVLEELLTEGRLTIYAETEFGQALEAFMEPIQEMFQEDKLDQSAQKQARRIRDLMKKEGYFCR